MFIRVKKIRKKDKLYQYAYIVENRWRKRPKRGKKGARQKVKSYLGRVYFLDKKDDKDFFEHYNIKDIDEYIKNNKSRIINELIKLELINHGFKEKNELLFLNNIFFEIKNNKIYSTDERNVKNKKVVLKLNEGFLCNKTINSLVMGKSVDKDGYKFARAFVDAGINIPKELFVKLYENVVKL